MCLCLYLSISLSLFIYLSIYPSIYLESYYKALSHTAIETKKSQDWQLTS